MKKLFFFRSSASSNGNNSSPPLSKDKHSYWENSSQAGCANQMTDKFKTSKKASAKETSGPSLRRTRSYSSGTIHESGLGQRNSSFLHSQNGSPSSSSISNNQYEVRSSRVRTLTPERISREKWFKDASVQNSRGLEKPDGNISSRASFDSSESSSYCSSNVSSKILDRFIIGEQLQETNVPKNTCSQESLDENRSGCGKRPPRITIPVIDVENQEPRSQSFRESKESQSYFSTKDWVENGFGHESPRKLAKHVIQRLSQSRPLPASLRKFDSDMPITIDDIYGRKLHNSCLDSDGDQQRGIVSLSERNRLCGDGCRDLSFAETAEDIDVKLLAKLKEAEDRAIFLSEEQRQESFLLAGGFNIPGLVQIIRSIAEERFNMALEILAVLKDRVSETTSARKELRLTRAELDSRTRRLEKEKKEVQVSLEKELDRRSNEWSLKFEKYQTEELRLRERVRELAEQNVSLQREVSLFSERDSNSRSQINSSEQQLQDLTTSMEEAIDENQILQKNIFEMNEKYRAAKEDCDCIRQNYEEKEKECKDLQRSITRMLRTCSEQEKTIDGLQEGIRYEISKRSFPENFDSQLGKLQTELLRLTEVEQDLRKVAESYRQEVDSLRRENINLLLRLKGGKKGNGSTIKLDQELWDRVCCLQNMGPTLLNECIQLCAKLIEHIKEESGQSFYNKQAIKDIGKGLDGYFVFESDVKLQGFKRGAENLIQSLRTVSSLLQEKTGVESQQHSMKNGFIQLYDQNAEEAIQSELRAEILLTRLLKEKLHSKELDMEQLQAEAAAAVRGNDILRCEVQNALDTLSCVTHEMKDLELQMINKDENINRLQQELQECRKELTIVKGIMPKVSEERDLMWDKVKQYSEDNMLLEGELNVLKKKIETLDEDLLLKEGQITILKDSIGKPFDLLASPVSAREFLLE